MLGRPEPVSDGGSQVFGSGSVVPKDEAFRAYWRSYEWAKHQENTNLRLSTSIYPSIPATVDNNPFVTVDPPRNIVNSQNIRQSQNLAQSQNINLRESLSSTLRNDGWEFIDPIASQVSQHNYNIHTSKTPAEKENLKIFNNLLNTDNPDILPLITQAQRAGIPHEVRAIVWQICLGYLPLTKSARGRHLLAKRSDYISLLSKWNMDKPNLWDKQDHQEYNLIKTDVIRTHPSQFTDLFDNPLIRLVLSRVLYIWAKENRDISYFQGLNDLASPFLIVYFTSCFGPSTDCNDEFETNKRIKQGLEQYLVAIEADIYWSLTALFTNLRKLQPLHNSGVHSESMMSEFRILMERIQPDLVKHLDSIGIEFSFFSFRWFLCFMTRELTTKNLIYLWDQYMAEPETGFGNLHIYICVAYLMELSQVLLETHEFAQCLFVLQKPPTIYWDTTNIEELLRKAKKYRKDFGTYGQFK